MEIDEIQTNSAANNQNIDNNLKNDMFNHLCGLGNKVFFKSQQINESELSVEEKKHIMEDIFERKHSLFLSRFGRHMSMDHLAYFRNRNYESEEENFNVQYYLAEIEKAIITAKMKTKNRRYAAMQKLIEDNEYFTEVEMMNRQPLLYEQLIGKYLSENEKKARDREENASVSNAFFGVLDRNDKIEKQERQLQDEDDDEAISPDGSVDNDDCYMSEVETFSRQQWGGFDDEKPPAKPQPQKEIKKKVRNNTKQDFITANERDLLREEFLGIMYSKFLSGEDEDIDYVSIDENPEYDNIEFENQDQEDKYFDSEMEAKLISDDEDGVPIEVEETNEDKSSEDELDMYMRHLNQHLKVQEMSSQFRELNN